MQNALKPLIVVAGVAAVLVIIAVASRSGRAPDSRDQGPLVAGLESRINDIDRVVITRGPDELVIEKNADSEWAVPSAGGYPADIDRLRPFVIGIADIEKVEPKTSDPAKHDALNLTEPTPDGSGQATRVQLFAAGAPVADVLFGVTDPAGVRGRSFFRLAGEDQTWLADGPNPPSPDFRQWVNTRLTDIAIGRVRAVTVNRDGQDPVIITRDGMTAPWTLASPEGETLTDGAGRRLGGALAFVNWTSALQSADMGIAQHTTEFKLFDGTTYTVTKHADQPLITVAASFNADERLENDSTRDRLADVETALQRVEDFNALHDGWVYTIDAGAANAIAPARDDLIASLEPAGPTPEAAPEAQDPEAQPKGTGEEPIDQPAEDQIEEPEGFAPPQPRDPGSGS